MLRALLIVALSFLAACQTALAHPQLIAIASPAMGGEALFHGTLAIKKGCVVSLGGQRIAAVLFDPGVTLSEDRTRIIDPRAHGNVRLAVPIFGGTAHLRENGKGWSIVDIERFFGVTIPAGCPTKNVMRLHGMEEQ